MIGTTVSHYRVVEKLGEGGMGVVYRAEDAVLLRSVALKVLPDEFSSDPERRKRFLREARIAAALNHPVICTIYEVGEEGDRPFIAMELVRGQTLAAILATGPLGLPDLVRTSIEVAEALAEAHAHEIVHRDLKPHNVIQTPEGRAKVLDFGLAKPAETSEVANPESDFLSAVTREGQIVGTLPYLSPEQALGGPVDQRSDIFSFGTMLYEMATGVRPFRGATPASTVAKILETEPEPMTALRPELPGDLGRIVQRCLRKRPEDRYGDTQDLVADLKKLQRACEPLTAAGRPWIVLFTAGLAAALIAGGALGSLWLRAPRPPRHAPASHRQLTFVGKAVLPALSPDGGSIAYVDRSASKRERVIVQDIAGGRAIDVFETEKCRGPRWAPDGRELAFGAFDGTRQMVYVVPRLGGAPRVLGPGALAAWSPDASRLATATEYRAGIDLYDRSGGRMKRIDLSGAYHWVLGIDWSPRGAWVVLTTSSEQQRSTLWVVSIETGKELLLLDDAEASLTSARWSQRGDAVYYLRTKGGTSGLWKLDVSPETAQPLGEPRLLVGGLQAGSSFTTSADSKRLLYTRVLDYSNLWLLREETAEASWTPILQLTTGTQTDLTPSVSPDGRQIAFARRGRDGASIFVMPAAGGPARQLTFGAAFDLNPVWSPDGKQIAFGSNEGGTARVWRIDVAGGARRVFAESRLGWEPEGPSAGDLAWSSGPKILYQAPGNRSFRFLDPASEQQTPLFDKEDGWVFSPMYSPDGSRLALYRNRPPRSPDSPRLRVATVIDLKTGSETMVIPLQPAMLAGWSSDGGWVYALDGISLDRIFIAPSMGGQPRVTRLPFKADSVSLGPDGHLVAAIPQVQSDVWLMEGFDADEE